MRHILKVNVKPRNKPRLRNQPKPNGVTLYIILKIAKDGRFASGYSENEVFLISFASQMILPDFIKLYGSKLPTAS